MNKVILDVANIITTIVPNNNGMLIKSFAYLFSSFTIMFGFAFIILLLDKVLSSKKDFAEKMRLQIGTIFVGLLLVSAILFYFANEKEKLDTTYVLLINDKLSNLIKTKKLDKNMVQEISKKILLCHPSYFSIDKDSVYCGSYNENPKKSHIFKILNDINSEKIYGNDSSLNNNKKEKEDNSKIITNKDLNI